MAATAPKKKPAKKPVGPPSDGRFHWESRSGKKVSLPAMSGLDFGVGETVDLVNATRSGNQLEVIAAQVAFLASALPTKDVAQIRKLSSTELDAMTTAWSQFSGATVGESSAS